ncbi:hypothetical protein T06_14515 [Trichinella sp. T6]|nr:hypothetical protein T06_14515 [Trichinella sp. T6]
MQYRDRLGGRCRGDQAGHAVGQNSLRTQLPLVPTSTRCQLTEQFDHRTTSRRRAGSVREPADRVRRSVVEAQSLDTGLRLEAHLKLNRLGQKHQQTAQSVLTTVQPGVEMFEQNAERVDRLQLNRRHGEQRQLGQGAEHPAPAAVLLERGFRPTADPVQHGHQRRYEAETRLQSTAQRVHFDRQRLEQLRAEVEAQGGGRSSGRRVEQHVQHALLQLTVGRFRRVESQRSDQTQQFDRVGLKRGQVQLAGP